ncbi:MAG: cobalt ECF transporter T component CbiQ [Desulfobacteraceae bacterium 4572_130]|nr:MAG: cobalt ECF transporter T component CbiQ [Desulfobacteraceae bacterium 4572_130]
MFDEILAHKNSIIHELDPRTRIISSLILSFAAALSDKFLILGIYFLISLALIYMASIDFFYIIKRLKPVFLFLLMIWIILPLTFQDKMFLKIPFFSFSKFLTLSIPGLELCAKITLKSITIVLIFVSLVATMTFASIGNGLHKLFVSDKMVFLILMTYRYISVIEHEYKKLLRAAKFRGFKPRTNLHSYRTYAYIAGMLFVRASNRAKRVYQAMVCRGFNGKFYTLDTFDSSKLSLIFIFIIFAITFFLVLIEAWI